jgi:alpha-1,2-mannosyltransferase
MPPDSASDSGRRAALGIILACSLGFSVVPIINAIRQPGYNKDYSTWYGIGMEVRRDAPLYSPGVNGEIQYMYPPAAAVLVFAPLTWLGPVGFTAALAALTGLAWVGSVVLSVRAATGRWRGHPRGYYLLVVLLGSIHVYDLFLLGQVNLILLWLVLLAMELLRRGRSWLAGLCLALAITIKVFPLPILVYWLVRREERAILATIFFVVLLASLPGAVRGPGRNTDELKQWFQLMIGDQSGATMSARTSTGFTRRNQSLIAVTHRLTRDVDADDRAGYRVNGWNLAAHESQWLGVAMIGLLGAVLLLATRFRFAPSPETDAMETAMVLILAVLCSPLAWTYFYCWLLPAWAVLLHHGQTNPAIRIPTVLGGLLLVSAFSEQFDPTLQAIGVTCWGGVTLFLILAWLRSGGAASRRS